MSIPEIGQDFEFLGPKRGNCDGLYPLSLWRAGDIVKVVAHVQMYGEMCALYWNPRDRSSSTVRDDLLKLVKTPEQLAADKRESAIRELMDIAQVDCRVTAARLVDAGFKREVV